METAKVDIRKLQMLNDSINRTIEALNQVRLSVHGGSLSHSSPLSPLGLQGLPVPGSLGAYGATPPPYPLSALSPLSPQYAALGHAAALGLGVMPGLAHSAQSAYAANLAQAAVGYGSPVAAEYGDPYATARIAQTFPFVHWGYSPYAWPNG